MKTFSFDVTTARLVHLITITRLDGTVIRLCDNASAIGIDSITWSPYPGLKLGDVTTSNDGTPASASFSCAAIAGADIDPTDIGNGKFNNATVRIEITDGNDPQGPDFLFLGKIGNIDFNTVEQVSFDLRSPYGYPRNIFVRIFAAMCQTDHGSTLCKIPILRLDVERSTAYALGDTARVNFDISSTPDGYRNVYLECTTAGTTAGTAPTFDDTVGNTTTDGTVVWTTRNAFERSAQVDTITGTNKFTIKNLTEPRASASDWFTPGRVLFQSGYSNQRSYHIAGWDPATNEVTLFMPVTDLIDADDWLNIWPGCDKTINMCVAKYANAKNFRGFPYSAGARFTSSPFGGIFVRAPSAQPGATGDANSGSGSGGVYVASAVEFTGGGG